MKDKSKTWLCPICGLVEMSFGETCKIRPCNPPHITGKFYIEQELKTEKSKGIANISDEGM